MTYSFKLNNQIYKVNIEEDENSVVVEIDGEQQHVEYAQLDANLFSIILDGKSLTIGTFKSGKQVQVFYDGNLYELESISGRELTKSGGMSSGLEIISPMPSRVVKILKEEGDDVEQDEGVVVVEAMKMESELKALQSGKIKTIKVKEGDAVEANAVLVVLSSE
ncbi:MAG: acetyl-CoA carboxylase biotin carboxyl carrier protein subunit [Thermodesulfobacteriota bacterium]